LKKYNNSIKSKYTDVAREISEKLRLRRNFNFRNLKTIVDSLKELNLNTSTIKDENQLNAEIKICTMSEAWIKLMQL
jgi:hypothetical protein